MSDNTIRARKREAICPSRSENPIFYDIIIVRIFCSLVPEIFSNTEEETFYETILWNKLLCLPTVVLKYLSFKLLDAYKTFPLTRYKSIYE